MGLNIPSGVTVRPSHGNETGQTRLQLPPCALHVICMVRMWRSTNLRSDGPQYDLWAWLLAALSLRSGIAALVVYPFLTILSPLLACVSSALQAFVTLQLVFSLKYQRQYQRQDVQIVDIRKGV